jgi:hypothetical protein
MGSMGSSPGLDSDSKKSKLAGLSSSDSDSTGKYSSSNGGRDQARSDSTSPNGVTSAELGAQIEFGPGGSGELGKTAGSAESDEGSGSREDARDYLSRIQKNESIFKIVSKRYEKEVARNHVRGAVDEKGLKPTPN